MRSTSSATRTAPPDQHAGAPAIGGGKAFGPYLDDQLAEFTGTTDKTLLIEPDFGHIDHFMTADHRELVERPIFEWAQRVLD